MNDEYYMSYAIALAKQASNRVKTNPNVGALLVYKDRIIGKGIYESFGGHHAEVNAINSVKNTDKHLISKSRLYVTLEPCCIHGKTPPCTSAIIEQKIPHVVVGTEDPHEPMQGKSIKLLLQHGISVTKGVLEEECKLLIAPFKAHLDNRPFVTLKWAQSKNGIIGNSSKRLFISNTKTQVYVHNMRANNDAILVGHNTLLSDNPMLTTRAIKGPNPIRIVKTNSDDLPNQLRIFNDKAPTIIITDNPSFKADDYQCQVCTIESIKKPKLVLSCLYNLGIHRVLVEGGAKTLKSFISHKLWDQAHIITSSTYQDGDVKSPTLIGKKLKSYKVGNDTISVMHPRT